MKDYNTTKIQREILKLQKERRKIKEEKHKIALNKRVMFKLNQEQYILLNKLANDRKESISLFVRNIILRELKGGLK